VLTVVALLGLAMGGGFLLQRAAAGLPGPWRMVALAVMAWPALASAACMTMCARSPSPCKRAIWSGRGVRWA
jgi:hypothetical protein